MIDDPKPYPEYKDSGVPWLGEVPGHWEVLRQRNTVEMRVSNIDKHSVDSELPVRLCNYVDVYKNERITARISFMRATATADEIRRFLLRQGDVLITKDSEAWNDIGVPAFVEYAPPDLVCGYHLALLRPRDGLMRGVYLLRALQTPAVAYQYHVSANGVTRYGLSHDAIKSVLLPVPPLSEQAAIVRFLDYADRRIRRYTRAKQKLIALMEEQKQVVIHRAVTRGLDPNVRLKPSGAEWLGDVPEHWEVLPIKRLFRSMDYGVSDSATDEGDIRLLTMGHIKEGEVSIPVAGGVSSVAPQLLLQPNDLLFNRTNSAALVGKVGLFRGSDAMVTFASYLVRMRPRLEYNAEYLNYLLNDRVVLAAARREALPSLHQSNLNPTRYGRLVTALPRLAEQLAIVREIAEAVGRVDRGLIAAQRQIALLREYWTRLIADLVTGRLDVRDAAARLPDDYQEPEPLDDEEALAEDDEESEGADLDVVLEEVEG